MEPAQQCDLRIVRRSQFADALRRYRIFVNSKPVGTIARNGVLDLKLPAGPVELEAKIDWCKSKPLFLELSPQKPTVVEVANNAKSSLFPLWTIVFAPGDYLVLREQS